MRIGIDCRLSGQRHAGIGRYIENLVVNLIDLSSKNSIKNKWILFFYNKSQAEEVLKNHFKSEKIEIVFAPIKHYSLAEQLLLPVVLISQKLDLLHVPHFNAPIFYPGKMVCTIHDLLWHEQKGLEVTTLNKWVYWIKYLGYKITTFLTVKKSKLVFVPSETIKKTLEKHYSFAHKKTQVIQEGVADYFKNYYEEISNSKILVYTGSLYPHKNIKIVFEALKLLPDHQLTIVGARNIFQNQTQKMAKEFGVENQVKFLGHVSDEKLIEIYHDSLALIQPSLSEGFGLTGIEAMASGLPVIASKIEIFKEIYQNGAIYFNPYSKEELVSAINFLKDKKNVKKLKEDGLKISQKYDWIKMASFTFEYYQKALNETK
jgi:glycosyltransferase involved in cell wall biosynthesis